MSKKYPKLTTLWHNASQESDFRKLADFPPLAVETMVEEMKELLKTNSFIDSIIVFRKKYRYQLAVCRKIAELAGGKLK